MSAFFTNRLSFVLISTVFAASWSGDDVKTSEFNDFSLGKVQGKACPGPSLLQANSHIAKQKIVVSDSRPPTKKCSLLAITDAGLSTGHLVLLMIIVAAAAAAGTKLCSGSKHIPLLEETRAGESGSLSSGLSTGEHSGGYLDIQKEESDSGDWEVGDVIGEQLGWEKYRENTEYNEHGVMDAIKEQYNSWKLLLHILGALAQFWAALAFMYWSLLYRDEELMNCAAYPVAKPHSSLVRHACWYSLACLRSFPILAANMVLVLMVRILIQTRMYYSMLELKVAIDFANMPVMRTLWPWVCMFSMLQGGSHFLLKAIVDPDLIAGEMYVRLVRKFVLPGTIFFSFLFRYADIENVLVPLNRIVEQDYHKHNRHCPWLSKLQGMNERVLSFDARHRDVVGATKEKLGKAPTINDIAQNMVDHYDNAYRIWEQRDHHSWGLFRSMWPAAVLMDRRIDRQDPQTRSWSFVFPILFLGCLMTSALSIYMLFLTSVHEGWAGVGGQVRAILSGSKSLDTESGLGNLVLTFHGISICVFIQRTVRNMFYNHIHDSAKKTWERGVAGSQNTMASLT